MVLCLVIFNFFQTELVDMKEQDCDVKEEETDVCKPSTANVNLDPDSDYEKLNENANDKAFENYVDLETGGMNRLILLVNFNIRNKTNEKYTLFLHIQMLFTLRLKITMNRKQY